MPEVTLLFDFFPVLILLLILHIIFPREYFLEKSLALESSFHDLFPENPNKDIKKQLVTIILIFLKELQKIGKCKLSNRGENAKGLNRYFLKEPIQVINKHMKRYYTSLVVREYKLKSQWSTTTHPPKKLK